MKQWIVNKTLLEFEEIYHVDAVNGLDTNDGLTVETAFKTIARFLTTTINNSALILPKGEIEHTTLSDILTGDLQRTFIGSGMDTKLLIAQGVAAVNIHRAQPFTIIDMIMCPKNPFAGANYAFYDSTNASNSNVHCKNVAFPNNGISTFVAPIIFARTAGSNTTERSTFENCVMPNGTFNHPGSQWATQVKITNCTQIRANVGLAAVTSLIIPNPLTAFNEKFEIIDNAINWQNAGTGENPDGTQAHIGVYGGDFAWGEWAEGTTISVTGEDGNIGAVTTPPAYSYMIDDEISGSTLNITEKVNDVVIRKIYGAERNREYTLEVPIMEFWQLGGNDSAISVTVENGIGEYTRTITFARDIKKVDIKLLPTVTTTRVAKLIPTVNYTGQATSVQILVSNNALDENPTWEEATTATQHIFANTTKTAENWAVAMRVTVEGEEGEHIALSPPSFTYST